MGLKWLKLNQRINCTVLFSHTIHTKLISKDDEQHSASYEMYRESDWSLVVENSILEFKYNKDNSKAASASQNPFQSLRYW